MKTPGATRSEGCRAFYVMCNTQPVLSDQRPLHEERTSGLGYPISPSRISFGASKWPSRWYCSSLSILKCISRFIPMTQKGVCSSKWKTPDHKIPQRLVLCRIIGNSSKALGQHLNRQPMRREGSNLRADHRNGCVFNLLFTKQITSTKPRRLKDRRIEFTD